MSAAEKRLAAKRLAQYEALPMPRKGSDAYHVRLLLLRALRHDAP
jgi:hypothetical protein